MSGLATKQQSLKIFEKLKTKSANKVRNDMIGLSPGRMGVLKLTAIKRSASTADRRTLPGPRSHLASTSVSTALPTTVTSVSTSPLSAQRTSIVCSSRDSHGPRPGANGNSVEWQWDQLRVMKVGGNESATKFFQQNGGTAALNSKDPKTKYQSNAATKYKEELKKRAARDAKECVSPR